MWTTDTWSAEGFCGTLQFFSMLTDFQVMQQACALCFDTNLQKSKNMFGEFFRMLCCGLRKT